ncbi:MAG: hypothetical protein VXZ82_20935 [Planctomycetota bacterium]|nr:hypothetical protein [Planctomycetota bacterium]
MSKRTGKIRRQGTMIRGNWVTRLPWERVLIALGLVVAVSAAFSGYAWQRVHNMAETEKQLQDIDASYAWKHATFDRKSGEKPSVARRVLAKYLGNALVSYVSSVRITENDVADNDLKVLCNLPHLRQLNLASDRATDKTLQLISQLPDLRYLSLAGSQFSVYGLLKLREAHQLRELRLDLQQLTPADVAVLKSELPSVTVSDANTHKEPHRMLFEVVGAGII